MSTEEFGDMDPDDAVDAGDEEEAEPEAESEDE